MLGVIVLLFAATGSRTEAQGQEDEAQVYRHAETGAVRFIGATKGDDIERPAGLAASASPEVAARSHLDRYGPLFGIEDQARELDTERVTDAGDERSAVRFQQLYKDVPILAGELNVEVDGLLTATGEALPDLSPGVEPGVSEREARQTALERIAGDRELEVDELRATEPELWIYNPGLLGGPGSRIFTLVWRMDVTPVEPVTFRELVLVDAQLGEVTLNFDQVTGAKDRRVCDANNSASQVPCASPVRTEGWPASSVADVNQAYDFSGETHDFLSTRFCHDSIDGNGGQMTSTVRYCAGGFNPCPYKNAS